MTEKIIHVCETINSSIEQGVGELSLLLPDLTNRILQVMEQNKGNLEFENDCIEILNDINNGISNRDKVLLIDALESGLIDVLDGKCIKKEKHFKQENFERKNFEKIREFENKWLGNIEETRKHYKEELEIKVKQAKTGNTIFQVRKNEQEFYLSGKYNLAGTLSCLRTEIEAKTKIVFLIGLGDTNFVRGVLEGNRDKFVVVYEPSFQIFNTMIKNIDITDLLDNRNVGLVISGVNKEEWINIINTVVVVENYTLLQVLISPNYEYICEEETKWAVKAIKNRVNQITVEWNTTRYFQDINEINIIRNIKFMKTEYTLNRLENLCNDNVPCIIVSAGPSLNKNIKNLKRAVGHACIIACDTALKPLKKAGIMPDFFLIVDPRKPETLIDFEFVQDIPAVVHFSVPNYILEKHKGKKFFYWDGDNFVYNALVYAKDIEHKTISYEESLGILPTGGSVATSAFSFACGMGAKTIILIGQDLAYTDNKTHADGTFKDKMDKIDTSSENNYIEVESIDGGNVKTIYNLKMYLEWFEDQIQKYPNINVIDATEGGALIHGSKVMPLQQAIQKECLAEWNAKEAVERIPKLLDKDDVERLDEYLQKVSENTEEVKDKIKDGIKCYKRLLSLSKNKNVTNKKIKQVLKNIKKINNYLDSNEVSLLATGCLQDIEYSIRTGMYAYKDSINDELNEVAKNGISYLEKLYAMVALLEPELKKNFCQEDNCGELKE